MSSEQTTHSSDAGPGADGILREEQGTAAIRLSLHMKKLHRHIASHVMSAMQDQLQDEDLSFSQMSALHQLRAYAPMSVGGLAERTGLSLPAASHLTDRLVVRGYAQRRENPDDRRAKLLDLSERGQQILDEMDRRFTDAYRVAFLKVSPEAVEVAADSVELLLRELQIAAAPEASAPHAAARNTSGLLPASPDLPPVSRPHPSSSEAPGPAQSRSTQIGSDLMIPDPLAEEHL